MTRDRADQVPQPTDPTVEEIAAIDGDEPGDADTRAHSMLNLELARTMTNERVREGEMRSRDSIRVREGRANRPSNEGGLFKRFRRS